MLKEIKHFGSGNETFEFSQLNTFNQVLSEYLTQHITNILPEAPNSDNPIIFNGNTYGRPQIRILAKENSSSGHIRFFEEDGVLKLRIEIEMYCEDPEITSLEIVSLSLFLLFHHHNTGGDYSLPMNIVQYSLAEQANILLRLKAECEISEDFRREVYQGFTLSISPAKLKLSYSLKWAHPLPSFDRGEGPSILSQAKAVESFEPKEIQVNNSSLLFPSGREFMELPSPKIAEIVQQILSHYQINRRFTFDTGVEGLDFHIYIDKEGKIPILDELYPLLSKLDLNDVHYNEGRFELGELDHHINPKIGQVTFPSYFALEDEEKRASLTLIKSLITYANANHIIYFEEKTPNQIGFANLLKVVPFGCIGRIIRDDNAPINIDRYLEINIPRNDDSVFGNLFDDLKPDLTWQNTYIPKDNPRPGEAPNHVIQYRQTNSPNRYLFLPQIYRIAAKEEGIPNIRIALWEQRNLENGIRIQIECFLRPLTHPLAKKDLIERVKETEGWLYVENIDFGGISNAYFNYTGNIDILGGTDLYINSQKVGSEPIEVSATGFNLTLVCSNESYQYLEEAVFLPGKVIGTIQFDLINETQDGQVLSKSLPIEVELSVLKLADIFLEKEIIFKSESSTSSLPWGVRIKNPNLYDVQVKGIDFTLAQRSDDGEITEVDYQLATIGGSFPLIIPKGPQNQIQVQIDPNSVNSLLNNEPGWQLVDFEPYSIAFGEDAQVIMKYLVDYTQNIKVPWELIIRFNASWENYRIVRITIADVDENIIGSLELTPDLESGTMNMIQSLSDLLVTGKGSNRQYKYMRTYLLRDAANSSWQDETWLESDINESNYLYISSHQ